MPFQIVRNDITKMKVDAIVNAANETLLGGGGVDGAIHRAAGHELLQECRTLGGCRTGDAKITGGYRLPCRYVIHTVGPIWQGGRRGEKEALTSCYARSLRLAKQHGLESIAFPMISAGAYGYPPDEAMQIAIGVITDFLMHHDMTVYLVVFEKRTFDLGNRLFDHVISYIDDVYCQDFETPQERQRRFLCQAPLHAARCRPASLSPEIFGDLDDALWAASLEERLAQVDESFSTMLLRKIDEKQWTDAECYRRANIDRRLFHKIKTQPDYKPSKQTALAFAVALEMDVSQAQELLMKAGYALSRSSRADIVVEYCLMNHCYDIHEINTVLFNLDLQPLGCF